MKPWTVLALLLLWTPAWASGDELSLDGVSRIAAPGVPGPLAVVGPKAFPVVAVPGDGHRHPVVAAARYGKGRVVAFGHSGYLGAGAVTRHDTLRLLGNAIRWAGGGAVVTCDLEGLSKALAPVAREIRDDRAGLPKRLERVGVLVLRPSATLKADADIERIRGFVRKGGGLIVADLGWGWKQLNPGKRLATDHPGNRLLAPMGIAWADGYLSAPGAAGYAVAREVPDVAHAGRALDALQKGKDDLVHASAVVIRAAAAMPPGDPFLLPRLEKSARRAVPRFETPLGEERALDRVLVVYGIERAKRRPASEVGAHPAAAAFPGEVPKRASRAPRSVIIDLAVPGWASTGLYAPPGETITVRGAAAPPPGVSVRIGAHRDRLHGKKEWRRPPEISFVWPLLATETTVASPFGGLIYIEVPGGAPKGKLLLEIRGAVRAPRFTLGETDPKEWKKQIRRYPAPWAEIGTSKVILTVPARVVRDLDDPRPVLEFWDRVLDACADLSGRPRERRRPERYVTDIQISAGYMHSGYPIMTHLDVADVVVDLEKMKAGRWGLFHEMGHNHQSRDWTFAGAGEVTVNLFTLYVLDTVGGPAAKRHGAIEPGKRARATAAHLAAGAPFEVWKKKPFLALYCYLQLQEAFGWDAFRKVFAEYRDLPKAARPKTDAEKRDQWMVRFSRAVGSNLGPFFTAWGIPTSVGARKSIGDLPAWMPEGFPPAR